MKVFGASCFSLGHSSTLMYRAGGSVSEVMTRNTVAASDTVIRHQCFQGPTGPKFTDVEIEIWGTDSTTETMI